MTKDKLLKNIAMNSYNVGFGAKKNFASHDIVVKLPSWIGFITLSIGILQLYYSVLGNNKELSVLLILISVASLYISVFNSNVEKFEKEGIRETQIFNKLKNLYFSVKSESKNDFTDEIKKMDDIMNEFYSETISKQVFMSQWYAHYKFFYEMQIDWIDEELKFNFFKDKIPNSLKHLIILILILTVIYFSNEYIGNL
ncbi:SLATT domain-containing protein [Flavobacterium columnare]|uniref:SLATT domain-containing protein n=1 Tax=Flavobacterium columnare TaxID=996 RepID=UPI0040335375